MVPDEWSTDRPYGRDELRWKIESMGVHPVDAADAVRAADVTRDAALQIFKAHGVEGEIRVASYEGHDEVVFVLPSGAAAAIRGHGLDSELQQLLGKKVWVTTEADGWSGRTEPF